MFQAEVKPVILQNDVIILVTHLLLIILSNKTNYNKTNQNVL